jgi:hypothetical protein
VEQIDRTLEEMIWRIVSRYAELAGTEPALPPHTAYGAVDGLFQQALLAYLAGNEQGSLEVLKSEIVELLPLMLGPVDAAVPA